MKFGKLEMNGWIAALVVIGVVSIIENGIVAATKWRRIRGLEKLAAMAASKEGVIEAAKEMAENKPEASED